MTRNTSIEVIMVFAALCLSHAAQAQAPEFDIGAIDTVVTNHMRDQEVPGVVIGVVVGDDVVYARGYGVADASTNAPMPPNATFQIASLTKLFTASLLVALEQDGVLRSGDPVDGHLEGAAPREAHGRAMRVRQLWRKGPRRRRPPVPRVAQS